MKDSFITDETVKEEVRLRVRKRERDSETNLHRAEDQTQINNGGSKNLFI